MCLLCARLCGYDGFRKEGGSSCSPGAFCVVRVMGRGRRGSTASRCHRTEGPLGGQRPGLWEWLERHLTRALCCFSLLFRMVGRGVWDTFLLIMKIMKIIPELRPEGWLGDGQPRDPAIRECGEGFEKNFQVKGRERGTWGGGNKETSRKERG